MYKSSIKNLFTIFIMILLLSACKQSSGEVIDHTKYTVSYESEISCNIPSKIEVNKGTVLSKDLLPEVTADNHLFLGWYAGDVKVVAGSFIITKNTTLVAKWNEKNQSSSGSGSNSPGQTPPLQNKTVTYKVKHYKQHIEDNEYSLLPSMTEEKTAKTGETTNAIARTFEGFTVKPFEQKTIESEFTVVEIYYDRNICEYTFDLDGGSIEGFNSNKIQFKYGEQISIGVPEKTEMIFTGWQPAVPFFAGETNQTFKANYEALKTTATYSVNHYKQNIEDDDYTFESSDTLYFSGNVGSLTTAEANKYKGFTVKPFEQQIIKDDDSTCVNIYYDRNIYSIEVSVNGWYSRDYEGSNFRLVNADTVELETVPDSIIYGKYGAPVTSNYYAFIGYRAWFMGTLTGPATIIPGQITSNCVLPLPEKFTDNVQIKLNENKFSIGRGIKFIFKMYNTVTGEVTEDINGLSIDDFMYYHDLVSNTRVKTEAENIKKFSDPISATTVVAQVRLPYIGLLYYKNGPYEGRPTGASIYDNKFDYSTGSNNSQSVDYNPYNCRTRYSSFFSNYPKIDYIECWYLEPDCSGTPITNFDFKTYNGGYTEENEISLYMKVTPHTTAH